MALPDDPAALPPDLGAWLAVESAIGKEIREAARHATETACLVVEHAASARARSAALRQELAARRQALWRRFGAADPEAASQGDSS